MKHAVTNRFRVRTFLKPSIIVSLFATVVAAILVPHFVDGHLLSLSNAVTQSIILSVDLAIAAVLIWALNREIARERAEKRSLEHRLDDSFRYIGRANVSLEIIRTFSSALTQVETNRETKTVFQNLHQTISVGVARADAARTRFIDPATGRTITEFSWRDGDVVEVPTISNAQTVEHASQVFVSRQAVHIRTGHEAGGILCEFAAVGGGALECDRELLRTLVEFFRVLFVESHVRASRDECGPAGEDSPPCAPASTAKTVTPVSSISPLPSTASVPIGTTVR